MSDRRWSRALFVTLLAVSPAAAQQPAPGIGPERKTIVAGERYKKSGFYRLLFGADYRDLWTTPVSLPVLDLRTFAGGLEPVRIVGHGQSKGLALKGADGMSYTFRPILKDASGLLPVELRESKARDFVQDQMASGHPAAHVMVGPLMDSVGLIHNDPQLVILGDSEALGQFRKDFGGVPGDIEVFAGTPGFKGTLETLDGEGMWARLRESAAVRADSRAYLKARLIDHVIGDWDRHRNQWRWARVEGQPRWQPIPEDRDQAFVRFEGLVMRNQRGRLPLLIRFNDKFSRLHGLTFDGWDVDKRILADLDWPAWDEISREVQAALTDPVLERAASSMPPEYYAKDGARLLRGLKSRRGRLTGQADDFYRFINNDVDVYLTDQGDAVTAQRMANGDLELSVKAGEAAEPYFHRRFRESETDEVRVYLLGGEDRVVVTGGRHGGVLLRVIGAGGRDVLDDSQGGGTRFSSGDDDDEVVKGPGTSWDRQPYVPPKNKSADWIPPRDWGRHTFPPLRLGYDPDLGALLGGSLITTGYGFRKDPYADRQEIRGTYAALEDAFRFSYNGDFRFENSPRRLEVLALASGLEVQRFFGFGNDTTIAGDPDAYDVKARQLAVAPRLLWDLGKRGDVWLTAIGKYSDSDTDAHPVLGPAQVYGEGDFGQVGAGVGLEIDATDGLALPTRGATLDVVATMYPAVWDVESTFGKLFAEGQVFLAPRGGWQPTLVLAAGGQKVFGDAPLFDKAFLGGRSRLGRYDPAGQGAVRGLRPQRYTGDALLYGNADLYLPVTRASFLGVPFQLGLQGFVDSGRVYVDGETSDTWHTGYGGGLYFASPGRRNLLSVLFARAEDRNSLYFRTGFAW